MIRLPQFVIPRNVMKGEYLSMYEAIDGSRIGKKIKEMRTQRGLTAEELAKKLGTSTSAVNMYECGLRIPRDEIKIRIADYFGAPIETIFYQTK